MGEIKFNWYSEISKSDDITQGDIFINFPIVKCRNYVDLVKKDNTDDVEIEIEVEYVDVIVLTQACDLARVKPDLENVILCRIHNIEDANLNNEKLWDMAQGKRPQFYMLNENEEYKDEINKDGFNFHIVNFNAIEKVPINSLKEYAKKVDKRLRLLPPYREHLSQAFAKYFMRIGLPSDIDKKELFEKNKIKRGCRTK